MNLHPRILLSSPSSDGSDAPSSSRQMHTNLIIASTSAAAASLFLALIYYSILRRRRLSSLTPNDVASSLPSRDDHPFWHVKTVGLSDSAIASLGSHPHAAGGGPDVDCSVCLSEIRAGEIVRLLPDCRHVFHVQCVDAWLRCHISCPLCRAPVVVVADPAVDGAQGPQLEEDGEGEEEVGVRVSVGSPVSLGGDLRSNSMDSVAVRGFQEGDSSNSGKEEGLEKGRSESGRNLWFSRLRKTESSSVLPL